VLSAPDRRNITSRSGVGFNQEGVDGFWRGVCPKGDVCVGTAFSIVPTPGDDGDCIVSAINGPDPIHEGDVVTWVINNPCGDDPVPSSSG
jgi:hypothetical protein